MIGCVVPAVRKWDSFCCSRSPYWQHLTRLCLFCSCYLLRDRSSPQCHACSCHSFSCASCFWTWHFAERYHSFYSAPPLLYPAACSHPQSRTKSSSGQCATEALWDAHSPCPCGRITGILCCWPGSAANSCQSSTSTAIRFRPAFAKGTHQVLVCQGLLSQELKRSHYSLRSKIRLRVVE